MFRRKHPAVTLAVVVAVTVGLAMMFKGRDLQVLVASVLKSQGIWKVIALLFALVNVKNLPLVWHVSLCLLLFFLDVCTEKDLL